jgi:hypothetical protein
MPPPTIDVFTGASRRGRLPPVEKIPAAAVTAQALPDGVSRWWRKEEDGWRGPKARVREE